MSKPRMLLNRSQELGSHFDIMYGELQFWVGRLPHWLGQSVMVRGRGLIPLGWEGVLGEGEGVVL